MNNVASFSEYIAESVSGEKQKFPKAAVLYVFRPETQYTCNSCVFYKAKSEKQKETGCALFAASERVKPFGTCGLWMHMDPFKTSTPTIPYLGVVTKEEAGYDENRQGFSCKRCEYFDADNLDCYKVRKDSEGDTPGIIHPNACCNRWEADKKRGSMTADQLSNLLEK